MKLAAPIEELYHIKNMYSKKIIYFNELLIKILGICFAIGISISSFDVVPQSIANIASKAEKLCLCEIIMIKSKLFFF